jgi:hypothetical protein
MDSLKSPGSSFTPVASVARWSASWRTAMQPMDDPLVAYPYVVSRLDGMTALRVWVSNQYGLRPIYIGAGYLAPAGTGNAHTGPGVAITFAGNAGVVIAPGA